MGRYVHPQKYWPQRRGGREGGGQDRKRRGNVLVLQPPLINHNANPKDSPEHDTTCPLCSTTCLFWLIPGTGRVHLTHPSSFTSCLQRDLEWADGKVILLYSNPGKALLTNKNNYGKCISSTFQSSEGCHNLWLKQAIPTNLKNLEYHNLIRIKKMEWG